MVALNIELFTQLVIHRFDDLSGSVDCLAHRLWHLHPLVATRQTQQADAAQPAQLGLHLLADVGFVSQHRQVCVLQQQFLSHGQVAGVGGCQLKVENDAAHRHQYLQFVAINRLFFGRDFAEGRTMLGPVTTSLGHQMEADGRHGQAVDDTHRLLRHIQDPQDATADEIEDRHEVASSPIEAALRGKLGKQGAMVAPETQHLGLHVMPATFADDRHCDDFAVAGRRRLRTGAVQEWVKLLADLIHDVIDPQAKVIKILYHHGVLLGYGGRHPIHSATEDILSNRWN